MNSIISKGIYSVFVIEQYKKILTLQVSKLEKNLTIKVRGFLNERFSEKVVKNFN